MGKKISMADQFYDACCGEYTLKFRDPGEFRAIKTGKCTAKISAYSIEGVGTVTLIRAGEGFWKHTESAVFTPTAKDAPILMMDDVRTLTGESMSINVFKTQLAPLYYRQFQNLEENYGRLPNADVDAAWYNELLISGSVAKKASNKDLSAMLEEYMEAYLKIVNFAESCKEIEKASKTRELSAGFLTKGGLTAGPLVKTMGEEAAEKFFDEYVFALKV